MRKTIYLFAILTSIILFPGCDKWLDVNTNPNTPTTVEGYLLLSSIEQNMTVGVQWDARQLGYLTRYWSNTAGTSTWESHTYDAGSDNAGALWRMTYWNLGENITMLLKDAEANRKWDFMGAGLAIQAWAWQITTDFHGPLILKQAGDRSRYVFDYDNQDVVYREVRRLCKSAIGYLERTDGAYPTLYKTDQIYAGDVTKWKKFTYGILARQYSNLVNKTSGEFQYKPDSVIYFAEKSLSANSDNATTPAAGLLTTDANFFGPMRNNVTSFRQTEFLVNLLNGKSTVFGPTVDPRLTRMLVPDAAGLYDGAAFQAGISNATTTGIRSFFMTNSAASLTNLKGRYLFADKAIFPLMTNIEMYFIVAEAAFNMGDKAKALAAYKNGISASLDFVSSIIVANPGDITVPPLGPQGTAITAAEKTAFLSNLAIVPTDPALLTKSMIMLQKYIGLWGFGFAETWVDLRKYHYDQTIYVGWDLIKGVSYDIRSRLSINNITPKNVREYAYRVRPRYNSEYVWNLETLKKFQGDKLNYHTKPIWFSTADAVDDDQAMTTW